MPTFKIDLFSKTFPFLFLCILLCSTLAAQVPAGQSANPALGSTLDQLQQTAQATDAELGHLRVDKWKADSDTKSAAEARVESLQRNLSAALPALLQEAHQKPTDIGVVFRLYRNLNAVYDVLNSVSEATEAFGSRQDADVLTSQTTALQNEQKAVADYLERLAADTQVELARYRAQAKPIGTPRKIIVDDAATPAKKTKKKTRATPTPSPQ